MKKMCIFLIILFYFFGWMIGQIIGLCIIKVDAQLDEMSYQNLLIVYDIKEEE